MQLDMQSDMQLRPCALSLRVRPSCLPVKMNVRS